MKHLLKSEEIKKFKDQAFAFEQRFEEHVEAIQKSGEFVNTAMQEKFDSMRDALAAIQEF